MKNKLTQIQIKNAPDGKLEDGRGLRLVKKGAVGKWVFRFSHLGKRREMGLGAWPALSLAAARSARDGWAAELVAGNDPIQLRDAAQAQAIAERDRQDPTFAELVTMVFESRQATLRGGGMRGRWRSPLDLYMIPAIGNKRISQVTQRDVVDALKPIWKAKHPTATKAIQRTRIVLATGRMMNFECDPQIIDAAKHFLGEVNHKITPMRSVAWQDVPELYAKLGGTTSGLCNQWIILTLVRMDAARGACLSEIDGDLWTVPADRMKGKEGKVQDFRVPLSGPALEIADNIRRVGMEYLFSARKGPISDAAVEKCLRTHCADGTPHGFRTSFRTWVQDTDACSFEVAETVLSHNIGGTVERSYARSDLLDRRRIVMDKWAHFVTGETSNVVAFKA